MWWDVQISVNIADKDDPSKPEIVYMFSKRPVRVCMQADPSLELKRGDYVLWKLNDAGKFYVVGLNPQLEGKGARG